MGIAMLEDSDYTDEPEPAVNSLVHLVFLDHVENGDEPLECSVYGVVTESTPDFVHVRTWDGGSDNSTHYCILRCAIRRWFKLIRVDASVSGF